MTVKYIPGVAPVVEAPPGTVEVSLTLTEDEFLLLHKLIGRTNRILEDAYWSATVLAQQLDPDRTRREALFSKHVPSWG